MSPLRWTTKSTRRLAAELPRQRHRVSADTVAELLRGEGFSLQGSARVIEGRPHPDRDAQFRYISEQARDHQGTADPVISVDAKKKEQVGNYASGGREYRPKGRPVAVRDHDFPDPAGPGKAVPYGIYDLAANARWASVGTDHDTAAFAVESIRRWWKGAGAAAYPRARRLLITADVGGSNGYRARAWKAGIADLAAQTGLQITVCHFPPGTSKWNKIEHRLFSHITMNWRGRPLTSHEVIVQAIAATTTAAGLHRARRARPRHLPHRGESQRRAEWATYPWTATGGTATGTTPCTRARCPARPPRPRPPRGPPATQATLTHPALTGHPGSLAGPAPGPSNSPS